MDPQLVNGGQGTSNDDLDDPLIEMPMPMDSTMADPFAPSILESALQLPSAPDFSFMDLVPDRPPVVYLEQPALLISDSNSLTGNPQRNQAQKPHIWKKPSTKILPGPSNLASEINVFQVHSPPVTEDMPEEVKNMRKLIASNVRKLATVSPGERLFRQNLYPDYSLVLKRTLDCTICGAHIGCRKFLHLSRVTHPLLKILVCCTCKNMYMKAEWSVTAKDILSRCRWCAKIYPTELIKSCSQCPFVYCMNCIMLNFSEKEWSRIISSSSWSCFVCQMVPLYLLRCTLWALASYLVSPEIQGSTIPPDKDFSTCCSGKQKTMKSVFKSKKVVRNKNNVKNSGLTPGEQCKKTLAAMLPTASTPKTSFAWVKARVTNFFNGVQLANSRINTMMNSSSRTLYHEKAEAIQEILDTLASMSVKTIELTSSLQNWINMQAKSESDVSESTYRSTTIVNNCNSVEVDREAISDSPAKATIKPPSNNTQKQPLLKPVPISVLRGDSSSSPIVIDDSVPQPPSLMKVNKSIRTYPFPRKAPVKGNGLRNKKLDYLALVKKYKLKPCSVVLERWIPPPGFRMDTDPSTSVLDITSLLVPEIELTEGPPSPTPCIVID